MKRFQIVFFFISLSSLCLLLTTLCYWNSYLNLGLIVGPKSGQRLSAARLESEDRNQDGNEAPSLREMNWIDKEPIVFNVDYWEQTGNALKNLVDLQCWARSVGIDKVLQPTVKQRHQSSLLFVGKGNQDHFQFSDLFDIDNWNAMSARKNFSRLSSLEYFYNFAIRDIVVVQMRYLNSGYTCRGLGALSEFEWHQHLIQRGFRFVRTVCIDFNRGKSHFMEEKEFNDLIFGRFNPQNVTILFNEWRGIRSGISTTARVDFKSTSLISDCSGSLGKKLMSIVTATIPETITYSPPNCTFPIVPSKRLSDFLDIFMEKYKLTGTRYIAVMLRTQKMIPYLSNSHQSLQAILSDWRDLKIKYNLSKTLFFTDVGKHGSLAWEKNTLAMDYSDNLYSQLNTKFSPDEMDSVLEGITGSKDSIQIALLQRLIVAHATCVVLAGGGSFQAQTWIRYLIAHKGQECYRFRLDPRFSLHYAKYITGL